MCEEFLRPAPAKPCRRYGLQHHVAGWLVPGGELSEIATGHSPLATDLARRQVPGSSLYSET